MSFSFILPILVTIVGLFLLVKLGFFFLIHPIRTFREFVSELKDRDARRSFFLALAGTLGVGNIFGVSAGIIIGGEGSLFWLFISSILSAVIKYAEVLLVFDGRVETGGMAGLLTIVFKRGKYLSTVYAALAILVSLFMGAAIQSAAVSDIARQAVNINPWISGFILVVLLMPALVGKIEKIEKITEIIIPMTTIIYIIMCLNAIFINSHRLSVVISNIVSSAFSLKSCTGGMAALAIKEGFARGVLSNEAGTGTSALAHSRSGGRSPHVAGLFGMCEVFFDTTILCTLTGLAILTSIENPCAYTTPMALVFAAFRSSLGLGSRLLLPLIFSFAYATIICWFFYGIEYCRLYFGGHRGIYFSIFLGFIFFAHLIPSRPLLYLTDLILLLMSCLTLCAIVKRTDRICLLSKKEELPD